MINSNNNNKNNTIENNDNNIGNNNNIDHNNNNSNTNNKNSNTNSDRFIHNNKKGRYIMITMIKIMHKIKIIIIIIKTLLKEKQTNKYNNNQ